MSIVKTIGKGVAWNTASTILGKVVIFANVFLMLRYLSVYEYGLGQLVLSVASTLGIFLLPGLASTIIADLVVERTRGEFGKMKALFLQFSILNILLGTIAWAILFFGSDLAAHLAGNDTVGSLLKIASFTILVTPLRVISTMFPSLELRYFDQAFYGILEEIVKFVFLVLFLVIFDIGLRGLLYAIVLSQLGTALLYLPRSMSAYRVFGHAKAQDWHAFWHMLRNHRKWGVANSYIGSLGGTLQLWIIRLLLGTEAVGIFAFAEGIFGQVVGFLPLGSVLAPLLPRYVDQRAEFARYVRSSIKAQLLFSIPLIVATFIGLPVLVAIFPKYGPAVPVIIAIIWSIIPSAVVSVYTPAFAALKKQYAFFWSTTWKIIFTGVFMALSISLWGLIGMGIGTTLFATASMIERTRRMKRVLPEFTFTLRDLFVFDTYERILLRQVLERWKVIRAGLSSR